MAENLQSVLISILKNYLNVKSNNKFGREAYAPLFLSTPVIRKYKKNIFSNAIGSLDVDSSAGNGHWAYVPWIRVYNQSIAPSPKKGLYLVYLFSNDMKHVYLSLAEGVTDFNKNHGRKKLASLKRYSKHLNHVVRTIINNNNQINNEIINNGTNDRLTDKKATLLDSPVKTSQLPKEYSEGGVVNITYSLFTLQHNLNNEELLKDLNIMCRIYNKLLNYNQTSAVHNYNKKIETKNKFDFSNIPLNEAPLPVMMERPVRRKSHTFINKKPNYLKKNMFNAREGNGGEKRVVKYEKRRLSKHGRNDLANKVKQVSKSNDRLGYDVNSYKLDGTPLYIEVKTTPQNSNRSSFQMFWRELAVAKEHPNDFKLYRVYNAKKHSRSSLNKLKLNIYSFNDVMRMAKKPESYQVYPNFIRNNSKTNHITKD